MVLQVLRARPESQDAMVNEDCLDQLATRESQGFKDFPACRDRRETAVTREIRA